LRFGIHHNPNLVGVGEGRKAATEPQGVRRRSKYAYSPLSPDTEN
jgi:hypothetical protein